MRIGSMVIARQERVQQLLGKGERVSLDFILIYGKRSFYHSFGGSMRIGENAMVAFVDRSREATKSSCAAA